MLIAIGSAFLAVWGAAKAHSWIGTSVALAQTGAPSPGGTAPATTDRLTIDMSLWAETRIKAFHEAFGTPAAPPLGVLRIRRLGLEAPVLRGVDELTLNKGVGWIPGTARPGEAGNSGLSAHRDGFFRVLKDIAAGDTIELETANGSQRYVVRSFEIVEPSDVRLLGPTGEQAVTLVTCYPFYFVGPAPQRFVVRAVRDTTDTATAGGGPTSVNETGEAIR